MSGSTTHGSVASLNGGYLIYHPRRVRHQLGPVVAHADRRENGNQDPYIWSAKFLHTFCHMSQMKPEVGDACFWVCGNRWPDFTSLVCDLVFVVEEKLFWREANRIERTDPLVESDHTWNDHYQWGNHQHPYKRRSRFTLKADPAKSFQPQTLTGELIDIVPFFASAGVTLGELRTWVRAGKASRPRRIDQFAQPLYAWIATKAERRISGTEFEQLRLANPALASGPPDAVSPCC